MSTSNQEPRERRRDEPVAGDFPASKAHHMGPEGEGPTPDEQVAEDTRRAAQERGAHSEKPVGGTKADADKP